MAGERLTIPIFELPLVLLPSERIPLHIFEERYKRMIRHCLAAEEPFGIVLRTDDGAREIGCTAVVEEVLEEFDDGRMNIIVERREPLPGGRAARGTRLPACRRHRARRSSEADEADPGPVLEAFEALLDALDSDAELDPDTRAGLRDRGSGRDPGRAEAAAARDRRGAGAARAAARDPRRASANRSNARGSSPTAPAATATGRSAASARPSAERGPSASDELGRAAAPVIAGGVESSGARGRGRRR